MLVFLLAQAGVPFTTGFLAKFYVISAAVQRGQYPLAIIAMLAAAVAAFFYLRVALLMYSPGPDGAVEPAGAERAAAGDMSSGAAEGAPVTVGAGAAGAGAAGAGAAGAGAAGVGAAAPAEAGAGVSPTAGARFTFNGGPRDGDGPVLDHTLTAGLAPVPGLDDPVAAGPAGARSLAASGGTASTAAGGTASTAAGETASTAAGETASTAAGVTASTGAGVAAAATLEAPPEGRIAMPVLVSVTLAVCAAFTIVAGVSAFMITFARQATMLF